MALALSLRRFRGCHLENEFSEWQASKPPAQGAIPFIDCVVNSLFVSFFVFSSFFGILKYPCRYVRYVENIFLVPENSENDENNENLLLGVAMNGIGSWLWR